MCSSTQAYFSQGWFDIPAFHKLFPQRLGFPGACSPLASAVSLKIALLYHRLVSVSITSVLASFSLSRFYFPVWSHLLFSPPYPPALSFSFSLISCLFLPRSLHPSTPCPMLTSVSHSALAVAHFRPQWKHGKAVRNVEMSFDFCRAKKVGKITQVRWSS